MPKQFALSVDPCGLAVVAKPAPCWGTNCLLICTNVFFILIIFLSVYILNKKVHFLQNYVFYTKKSKKSLIIFKLFYNWLIINGELFKNKFHPSKNFSIF